MSDKSGQQGLITHTSGPWDASHDADGDYAIFSFGGILVCVTDSDTDEDKANARLIAAAPDMLAALKASNDLLFGLLDYFDPGHELSQINAQRDKNIEAIAKAECGQ